MIPRHLLPRLQADARALPVVTLTGPRQSGKTTLARAAFPDLEHVSLEDPQDRQQALEDPRGFLNRFAGPVILDEVQRAPDLFSYIQVQVDQQDSPGQFVLTGSHNFLLMRTVSQTLAGRCAIHHLLPFSFDELCGRQPRPLSRLGEPGPHEAPDADLFGTLLTGFYPRIHDRGLDPQRWLRSYYQAYLERDVRQLVNVGDLDAFRRFVGLCAGRAGQLLNLSSLANDCGITHTTARRWLSVLEASFVVILLRPYYKNYGKRLIKAPKLHFVDTGLLCYLLRIREPKDLQTHASRGAVFESYVVSELTKRALNDGRDPDLYFWRDSRGHEIDVLLDQGTEQVLLEVKSGQTVVSDFTRNIRYWRDISGADDAPAVVVYGGDRNERRKDAQVTAWWNL
jgi:predicted AAA+ superfamily ATPase